MQPRNLAARAGRWSATHRKTAIIGWILFVVLATMIGGKVGQQNLESSQMGNGESKRGDMIVEAAGFPDQAGEQVIVQGKGSVKADDPQVTAAVKDVVSRLERIEGITEIESPLDPQYAGNISDDRRSVLVNFKLPGDEDKAKDEVAPSLATVAALQRQHPEVAQSSDDLGIGVVALAPEPIADDGERLRLPRGRPQGARARKRTKAGAGFGRLT